MITYSENYFPYRFLAELIDVSSYGSSISVVHGLNGAYLVNRTNSITSAFDQLQNFTGACKFLTVIIHLRHPNIRSEKTSQISDQRKRR